MAQTDNYHSICIPSGHNNGLEDLEDMFRNKNVEIKKIQENGHKYKEMVREIIHWAKKHEHDIGVRREFNNVYNQITKKYRIYVKKNVLIHYYRVLIKEGEVEEDPFVYMMLQKRPARNISGVTVITVLTSPYPDGQKFSCKHNCYYCPNEPDMPRSYLKEEPAVARGFRNKWGACEQMLERMHTLQSNGHELDKLEIIIEGGTYT